MAALSVDDLITDQAERLLVSRTKIADLDFLFCCHFKPHEHAD
jgi:hypothetical protein